MYAPWKDLGQKADSEMWVRKMKCGSPLRWAKPHCANSWYLKRHEILKSFALLKRSKKDKTCKYRWINTTHAKPPWGKCSPAALQWSGVECPVEFSVMTGLFKHLLCPAPWHLATWCYCALEMWWVWLKNWMLYFIYLWVIVCTTWLGEYFIGQCRSRLGGSCPVSTPGTPAPSGHMAGKRLRGFLMAQW